MTNPTKSGAITNVMSFSSKESTPFGGKLPDLSITQFKIEKEAVSQEEKQNLLEDLNHILCFDCNHSSRSSNKLFRTHFHINR